MPCFVVREQTRFYFDELQNLYDIYKPFLIPFVQTLTEDILAPLATEEASAHCLDVVSWLLGLGAVARPAVPYLASVPISFQVPLTRLVQYLPVVVCHIANLTPSLCELRSRLSGAMGHSQLEGILYPCNADDTPLIISLSGEVYSGINVNSAEKVAIKLELATAEYPQLKNKSSIQNFGRCHLVYLPSDGANTERDYYALVLDSLVLMSKILPSQVQVEDCSSTCK
jgi:hypothetical protein